MPRMLEVVHYLLLNNRDLKMSTAIWNEEIV